MRHSVSARRARVRLLWPRVSTTAAPSLRYAVRSPSRRGRVRSEPGITATPGRPGRGLTPRWLLAGNRALFSRDDNWRLFLSCPGVWSVEDEEVRRQVRDGRRAGQGHRPERAPRRARPGHPGRRPRRRSPGPTAPAAPPARPSRRGRPRALRMSVPRRTPPSTRTSTSAPTSAATPPGRRRSRRTYRVGGRRDWTRSPRRPPASTQARASSARSTPLTSTGRPERRAARRCRRDRQPGVEVRRGHRPRAPSRPSATAGSGAKLAMCRPSGRANTYARPPSGTPKRAGRRSTPARSSPPRQHAGQIFGQAPVVPDVDLRPVRRPGAAAATSSRGRSRRWRRP